ncbi:ACP S-malonyltransferase [Paenibacillus filicis]|uniref:Malonyl CoA-acyl carrier protein transacylase n=1 Tax=Paenibacillus gyeongsangnamensis TaxID=3388067 RepID=A0ABT4Q8J7_9BACL|nr:ACP S-malonyltransferase [Paenibacillus filicis]MCZ8513149.1 ACP S-malonyltransferase [Paenibacillus filicis]
MSSNVAFVFPGQGAQSVGMGKDLTDHFPGSRAIFEEADQVLGYPLSRLIFHGPADELKKTYHTQPALLATSIAFLEAFKPSVAAPHYVLGHSLGEYSALVATGVLSFADAVRIVRARGQFMDEAVPSGQGEMAAVIGLDREELTLLCEEASRGAGLVELANINSGSQIVISGTKEGVRAAAALAEARGAKRVLLLEVSGPFHSSLMKPAAERLIGVLADVTFREARVPVIANVSAEPLTDPEAIRQSLIRQVYSPVLWEDSIKRLLAQGVDTFYEIGPGTVLAGLIKKINRTVTVRSINHVDALLQCEV